MYAGKDIKLTFFSFWAYPFRLMQFGLVPYPLRYIAYRIAELIRSCLYPLHRFFILLTCRLEALRRGRPKDTFQKNHGRNARFSVSEALHRLHGGRDRKRDPPLPTKEDMKRFYIPEHLPDGV